MQEHDRKTFVTSTQTTIQSTPTLATTNQLNCKWMRKIEKQQQQKNSHTNHKTESRNIKFIC